MLVDIFETWTSVDGRPKIHLSSQAAGAPPGAHAAVIDVRDVLAFLEVAPPVPFDCMLEAKEKDRALLRLRAELGARGISETHAAAGSAAEAHDCMSAVGGERVHGPGAPVPADRPAAGGHRPGRRR